MSRMAALFDPLRDPVLAEVAEPPGRHGDFTDPLVRLMAAVPARLDGRPLPRVVAVTTARESIGLLLSEPRDDPATGFDAIDGGLTWTAEPLTVGRASAGEGGCGAPWPLLVPFGQVVPDGPAVMANLEELGAVELSGEPADVLAFAESLAADLAADRFGGHPRVVCVNCAWELDALEAVRVVASLNRALADAETHRRRADAAEAQWDPLPELRRHGMRGVPRPLVIIDPHGHDPQSRARLVNLAGPGLAVVTATRLGDPTASAAPHRAFGDGWTLHLNGRSLRWEPVGVDLRFGAMTSPKFVPDLRIAAAPEPSSPQGAAGRTSAGSPFSAAPQRPASAGSHSASDRHGGRWSALAADGSGAAAVPRPGMGGFGWAGEPPDAGLRAAVADASPGAVDLQVLGVVQAVGAALPFTSQRALDLACYLAFHRDGATADKLRYWLWRRSEPPPRAKTFANVASRARVCLGRDADGKPYLSHLGADGVYRLSEQVTTDLERFAAWLRLADRVPPQQALECLRAALWLVRGAPFGGGSGVTFSWADASWRSHVDYLVDSTVHRLADAALELDRVEVARWATLRGLAITPDCEQCYQRRIAAARRSGYRREVDLVMRHMDRLQREPLPELDGLPAGALEGVPSAR
ncbi:MAG: hypothetical protein J4F44_04455 [Acidimicrobiia bacterium]|nr:hypothetical protein [Acidimicrobiia bacterium]